jgi:hypothetical protein
VEKKVNGRESVMGRKNSRVVSLDERKSIAAKVINESNLESVLATPKRTQG